MKKAVAQLAAVHGVARIIGQPFAAGPPPGLGLKGQGEIVAVCDTALDTGVLGTLHPDFTGRVLALKSYRIALCLPVARPASATWAIYAGKAGVVWCSMP
jgi:hypothetical protein